MKKKREPIIICPIGLLACKAGECQFYNKKIGLCVPRSKNPEKYSNKLIFKQNLRV